MDAPSLVSAQSVRDYMELNASSSSRYSDATIGSNIRAAGWLLERATGRLYADRTLTLVFTTEGRTLVPIPGLRTATTITLAGSVVTADSTYWLLPDVQQTGVSTGIQFRAFDPQPGGPWYWSISDWWDRGLDLPGRRTDRSSLPNDLSIAGSWGYTDALLPEPVRHATKVLAAYYTKRPDAILSGAITTEAGIFDLSSLPIEIQGFIADWRVGSQVTAV